MTWKCPERDGHVATVTSITWCMVDWWADGVDDQAEIRRDRIGLFQTVAGEFYRDALKSGPVLLSNSPKFLAT